MAARCWRPILFAITCAGLGLWFSAAPAGAADFTVATTQDGHVANGAPPGACISDLQPYPPGGPCTLRAAIEASNALGGGPHNITLPAGLYNLIYVGAEYLSVSANVRILGAGQATTTIRGNGSPGTLFGVCGGGCPPTPQLTLSDLTVTNPQGIAIGSGGILSLTNVTISGSTGTAINNNQGTATLTNVTISGNTGAGCCQTAGISNYYGPLTANNLVVTNNTGTGPGIGGIANDHGTLTLTNTTIQGNTSPTGLAGGLWSDNGPVSLTSVVVDGNSIADAANNSVGGGLYVAGAASTQLNNVTVSNNQVLAGTNNTAAAGALLAPASPGSAVGSGLTIAGNIGAGVGGLLVRGGPITLDPLTVQTNRGRLAGGVYVFNDSLDVNVLRNATIAANTATAAGTSGAGGIAILGGLTLDRTTVSGNSGLGVGLQPTSGRSAQLTNDTISGNSAGGIHYLPAFGLTAQLTNVTVASNSGGVGLIADVGNPLLLVGSTLVSNQAAGNCSGGVSSLGSNLSGDTSCASSFTQASDQNNVNPLLGPLANNGGPTQTHALAAGSPAIDAVVSGCPPPPIDQRGVSRPQGIRCDVGAYEAPPPCQPRPPIGVTVAPSSSGRLQATVSVQNNASTANNTLRSIQFTSTNGALLESSPGQPIAVPSTVTQFTNPTTYSFLVRQASPPGAATAFLSVTDACGPWTTFVGGGPSAFPGGDASAGPTTAPRPTPAPSPTPTAQPPAAPPPTPTPPGVVCTPRPALSLATTPRGAGQLQVTISVPAGSGDRLQALRFGATTNAVVDGGDGVAHAGSFTLPLPAGSSQAVFLVQRQTAGQAVSVPLVVVDNCGEWPTLVGGGADAF